MNLFPCRGENAFVRNLARLQRSTREIPVSFLFRETFVARYAFWFHGLVKGLERNPKYGTSAIERAYRGAIITRLMRFPAIRSIVIHAHFCGPRRAAVLICNRQMESRVFGNVPAVIEAGIEETTPRRSSFPTAARIDSRLHPVPAKNVQRNRKPRNQINFAPRLSTSPSFLLSPIDPNAPSAIFSFFNIVPRSPSSTRREERKRAA